MTNLISFSFESSEIRTLTIDGNPWFVGKDACDALGYKDTVNALKLHCKGVAKYHPLPTPSGTQEVRIINEPDIYRLITGSTLPEAERFERWLFEEVLPSIRKTGLYAAPDFRDPLADFGPLGDGGAQHVARRKLDHAALSDQALGLGPLTGSRRSKQNQVQGHGVLPIPT